MKAAWQRTIDAGRFAKDETKTSLGLFKNICIADPDNDSEPDLGFLRNPHPDPGLDPSF
jgi:hypothetical protein